MDNYMDLKEIVEQFDVSGEVTDVHPIGNGHINGTFEVTCGGREYILQEINHYVFKHPKRVVSNVFLVTEYLRKKIEEEGGNPDRETLHFIYTKDGDQLLYTNDDHYYRLYRMVEDAEAFDELEDNDSFFHVARAIGIFTRRLQDFDSGKLYETIPDFHDTRKRLTALTDAIRADMCGRVSECMKEITFVMDRIEGMGRILDGLKDGSIPKRVTHNDTKVNNILLDPATKEEVCVIDLDTVMEGSILYDVGDALRSGSATVWENEPDVSKVKFDPEKFRAFMDGFLLETAGMLTKREKELLDYSAWLITMEQGVRFLTDYFSGDAYFSKIAYPTQNLDRARNQFALALDMETQKDTMRQIVDEMLEKHGC